MARWTPALHEPSLDRRARRAHGVYYTPAEIVQHVCGRSLQPLAAGQALAEAPLRLLDPSCGAGAFLVAAAESLFSARPSASTSFAVTARFTAVRESIFGIDLDPAATHAARRQLARLILGSVRSEVASETIAAQLTDNIVTADALLDELPPAFARGRFDLVLGNPPYVNIRQLVKQHGADYVARLRERYPTATGNFDLYTPFLERAWQLLRTGGRCAFVLPNKIAGSGYAAECRRMLLEQTELEYIVDLSAAGVFAAAGVYPWILGWRKGTPKGDHQLRWQTAADASSLRAADATDSIEQSSLQADGFRRRSPTLAASHALCQPLGERGTLECGTAGYMAHRVAALLYEQVGEVPDAAQRPRDAEFIVSGNIDRYSIEPGNVRYLGKRYRRPQLSLDDPTLTPRQRRLFAQPKIVVSGMTRRLEAAYDVQGLALGVQVYAILPPAGEAYYLLGLLNSRWLSYWFREQFAAKQLAGGYFGINKAQLTQLPIRLVASRERADVRRRREVAEAAEALSATSELYSSSAIELDRRVDQLVYELYRLSDAQIAECEAHFDSEFFSNKRAA